MHPRTHHAQGPLLLHTQVAPHPRRCASLLASLLCFASREHAGMLGTEHPGDLGTHSKNTLPDLETSVWFVVCNIRAPIRARCLLRKQSTTCLSVSLDLPLSHCWGFSSLLSNVYTLFVWLNTSQRKIEMTLIV